MNIYYYAELTLIQSKWMLPTWHSNASDILGLPELQVLWFSCLDKFTVL